MAAYGTPAYEYAQGTSGLAQKKAQSDAANEYARFISQQRFRQQQQDLGQQFRRQMPKVGQSFQNRGLWNSGLRRSGQRQFAGDYNQALQRSQQAQAADDQQFQMQQNFNDQDYNLALMDLYQRFQAARANTDPFANVYLPGR